MITVTAHSYCNTHFNSHQFCVRYNINLFLNGNILYIADINPKLVDIARIVIPYLSVIIYRCFVPNAFPPPSAPSLRRQISFNDGPILRMTMSQAPSTNKQGLVHGATSLVIVIALLSVFSAALEVPTFLIHEAATCYLYQSSL